MLSLPGQKIYSSVVMPEKPQPIHTFLLKSHPARPSAPINPLPLCMTSPKTYILTVLNVHTKARQSMFFDNTFQFSKNPACNNKRPAACFLFPNSQLASSRSVSTNTSHTFYLECLSQSENFKTGAPVSKPSTE